MAYVIARETEEILSFRFRTQLKGVDITPNTWRQLKQAPGLGT